MSGKYSRNGGGVGGLLSPLPRDSLRQERQQLRTSWSGLQPALRAVDTAPALFNRASMVSTPYSPDKYDKLRDFSSMYQPNTSLPSISARQRPLTYEGRLSKSSHQKGRRALRQSWPSHDKPRWVGSNSNEWSDNSRLEERFRAMTAQEGSALMERLETFSSQHKQSMGRTNAVSPLVVCVLDEFASTGGLLQTTAGQEVSFAIQVKYSFAGKLGEGGGDLHKWVDDKGGFTCTLTGPVTVNADVIYQGAGTYIFMYKAKVAGVYMVSVRLGDGDVPGSPFESLVTADCMSIDHSTVSGLGLLCAEAGKETRFQITSRDRFGNRRPTGGDPWDASFIGPLSFNATVVDNADGVYHVKYTTIMCGDYYITVESQKRCIPGCPFVLTVVAGRTHGPSCSAVGAALVSGFAGHENEFIIEARDIIGNQRVVGDDAFEVRMEGPSTPQVAVFDRDDGTYLVTYSVRATGTFVLRISLMGYEISGSPWSVQILAGMVMAVRCTGVGRGLTRSYAGEDAKFTIESRDAQGNKTESGKKPFRVSVRGIITPQVHCIEGENGEFHYSYRTAKAGIYFVSVLLEGVDIGGSPFKLTVDPGPAHANGCSASGPGITGGYATVETSFTIQSRDYFGNPRARGGDTFNVQIGGTASADMRIRDNDNGTYSVAYTPMVGGDYFISVQVDGIHIQESPFTISSDPLPREAYLEIYRSMEPDFKDNIEAMMSGIPDKKSGKAREKKAGAKKGGSRRTTRLFRDSHWVLNIKLLNGKDLAPRDTTVSGTYGNSLVQTSDPYVVFTIGKKSVRSTTVLKDLNPTWNEELEITLSDRLARLGVEVMDEDVHDDDDSMGKASVPITDMVLGQPKMVTCTLKDFNQHGQDDGNGQGSLQMVLTLSESPGNINSVALR